MWSFLKRSVALHDDPPAPEPRTRTYAGETGLVEITAPAAPGCPPSAEEQAHHRFLTANWPRLAAAAYAGFRRHGIGMVVIEKRPRETPAVIDAFEPHDLAYATGMGMWTQRPPHSSAPDWLDEQFQTYEPLEAGLFLFRSGADADRPPDAPHRPPRPYHAAGTPAPPDALDQARAPFN
ncbi:MAG: hypothetical protein BRD46_03955 [Bacteroidetes bacterium QS_8_68_15]|nr:MAG: hypothetical protein BRD46_03955 [Bacteroidetes bacterium QS_8_68_15]